MRGLEPPASWITTRRSNRTELHPPGRAPVVRSAGGGYAPPRAGSKRGVVLAGDAGDGPLEFRPDEGLPGDRMSIQRA